MLCYGWGWKCAGILARVAAPSLRLEATQPQETLQAASQACLAFPYMEFSLRYKGMIDTSSVTSREQMTMSNPLRSQFQ